MSRCHFQESQGCDRKAAYWLKMKNKSVGHRFSGEEMRIKICELHYNEMNPEHKHRLEHKGVTDGLFDLARSKGISDSEIQFGYEEGYTDDFIVVFSKMH